MDEGELIGYADNTGASSGAHLDYRFYLEKDQETKKPLYVNPLGLLPYCNTEIPRVEILAPEDGTHVGKEEQDREVIIKANVQTEEKDLSKVYLTIERKEAPGAEFNFEEEGRFRVKVEGVDKTKKAGSYVEAGDVYRWTGSDDIFVYKWDTRAFLDEKGLGFVEKVPIKAFGVQAKGEPGEAEIEVDVGVPTLEPKEIFLGERGSPKGENPAGEPVYMCSSEPEVTAVIGVKEKGARLTGEMVDARSGLLVCSEEQALTPEITIAPDKKTAELTAKTSGLKDNRHTARVEVLDADGKVTDSKNLLFIIDTKPPELELVQPAESKIAPPERSFLSMTQREN